MLSRKNRMSSDLFERVRTEGKRVKSPYFSMVFRKNDEKQPQFAVVVSKKKLPSAVRRHFQKRKVFSALEGFIERYYGIQAIFFLEKEAFEATQEDIKQEIERVFVESEVNSE